MRFLFDTHILLWGAIEPEKLSEAAIVLFEEEENELIFSAVSIWEIAIKAGRGRKDFEVEAAAFRHALIDNGYIELPMTGLHAMAVTGLPPIHRDPFDRMLVAQAQVEGTTLVTSDATVARYPGPIRLV